MIVLLFLCSKTYFLSHHTNQLEFLKNKHLDFGIISRQGQFCVSVPSTPPALGGPRRAAPGHGRQSHAGNGGGAHLGRRQALRPAAGGAAAAGGPDARGDPPWPASMWVGGSVGGFLGL